MDNQGGNVQKSGILFQKGFPALHSEIGVGENVQSGGGHHACGKLQKMMRILRIRHRKVLPIVNIRPDAHGRGAEHTLK